MKLKVDLNRQKYHNATHFYVSAYKNGVKDSFDIAELEKDSLIDWLETVKRTGLIAIILMMLNYKS